MKPQKRWIKSAIETAAKSDAQLPWERGARRQLMIAARREQHRAKRSS